MEEWENASERALNIQSRKYQYTSLFGKLVTEWLEHPNGALAGSYGPAFTDPDIDSQDSFEQVGRAEMQEQRAEWESIEFNPSSMSEPEAIKDYLSNLSALPQKPRRYPRHL